MFVTRSRPSENIRERQRQRKFLDVMATEANIPLACDGGTQRWCTLPLEDETYLKEISEFQVRDDDVYVVTFPKSGTTWLQEASWLLMNNLNFEMAKSVELRRRSVFMEFTGFYTNMQVNTMELARNAASPRVLKSHLPAHLLPQQIWEKRSKIVYCARNPKDIAVSYFHFFIGLGNYQGSIDEFVEDLINDDIMYTPYWQHLLDFWQMRQEPNIFFVTYEDLKRDLKKVLLELNSFLERPALEDEDLHKLEEHLSFTNMKANSCANHTLSIIAGHPSANVRPDFQFMRRGIVGAYKNELSLETQDKLDKWSESNLAKYNLKIEDIFGELRTETE